MTSAFRIRPATVADAALLARHRVEMFIDMGSLARGGDEEAAILRESGRFCARELASGGWTAWIAEDATGPIGGFAATLRPLPPRPGFPKGGEQAYLLNAYVEPRARRRGVATALVRACLAWCAARGVSRIVLHASAEGRPVYSRLGFVPRDGEMTFAPPSAP